ncbi:MAG: hypothetical protein ITD31_01975 [Nitrosospira sp.]|nr:hypothetical protein [Nitrosospira sp.]
MPKTKFSILLFLMIYSFHANADGMAYLLNSTPNQRAESQTRFMKNKLGLSDEKVNEIRAINLQFAEKAEPILKGSSISFIKMNDMKNIQKQKDAALHHVLTEQQFQLYSNSKDELKDALKADLTH